MGLLMFVVGFLAVLSVLLTALESAGGCLLLLGMLVVGGVGLFIFSQLLTTLVLKAAGAILVLLVLGGVFALLG